jgi:hypothetical protein
VHCRALPDVSVVLYCVLEVWCGVESNPYFRRMATSDGKGFVSVSLCCANVGASPRPCDVYKSCFDASSVYGCKRVTKYITLTPPVVTDYTPLVLTMITGFNWRQLQAEQVRTTHKCECFVQGPGVLGRDACAHSSAVDVLWNSRYNRQGRG